MHRSGKAMGKTAGCFGLSLILLAVTYGMNHRVSSRKGDDPFNGTIPDLVRWKICSCALFSNLLLFTGLKWP